MGYEFINKLPTPAEIKEQFPLPVECAAAKAQRDEEVKKAMKKIVELEDISKCDLNTDYNYTDVARKKYRYQAVFDITHY